MVYRVNCFGEIQSNNVNCAPFTKPSGNHFQNLEEFLIVDRRGRKPCRLVGSKERSDKCQLFLDNRFKDFADNKWEADGSELSVVWSAFETRLTIEQCQSSET